MAMTRFEGMLNGEPAKGIIDEYLRRNLLHAASVGTQANVRAALSRLRRWKRPPAWLVEMLEGAVKRAERVSVEMAAHRDEIKVGS